MSGRSRRRVLLTGATGAWGRAALRVMRELDDRLTVLALALPGKRDDAVLAQFTDMPNLRVVRGDLTDGDAYAASKVVAERMLVDAGLPRWTWLRQTGILHPGLLETRDPIFTHQPLGEVMEWVSDLDSARLLARIALGEADDALWGAGHWCPTCTADPRSYERQAEANAFLAQVVRPSVGLLAQAGQDRLVEQAVGGRGVSSPGARFAGQ